MDLSKRNLPAAVIVDGAVYPIKTDFRYYIALWRLLKNNKELTPDAFDFLYIEGNAPQDRAAGASEIMKFYAPPRTLPRKQDGDPTTAVMDYDLDAELIYAGFMQDYGLDLCDEKTELHWHKFLALLAGLRKCKLTEVIGYRLWKNNSDKEDGYTKQMQQLQNAWQLEETATDEEIDEALTRFEDWLSGKRK